MSSCSTLLSHCATAPRLTRPCVSCLAARTDRRRSIETLSLWNNEAHLFHTFHLHIPLQIDNMDILQVRTDSRASKTQLTHPSASPVSSTDPCSRGRSSLLASLLLNMSSRAFFLCGNIKFWSRPVRQRCSRMKSLRKSSTSPRYFDFFLRIVTRLILGRRMDERKQSTVSSAVSTAKSKTQPLSTSTFCQSSGL